MDDVNKRLRIFLSLSKLEYDPQETNSRTLACIWNFQQFGIDAKRKEKTRIRFNSDASAGVAVVDVKAP